MRFGAPGHIRAKYQARAAVDNRDIEVLDENWCAVDVFLACGTQWRVIPMGGMQGIDYTGLQSTMAMMAVDDVPTVFAKVRTIEAAVLNVFRASEQKARQQKQRQHKRSPALRRVLLWEGCRVSSR